MIRQSSFHLSFGSTSWFTIETEALGQHENKRSYKPRRSGAFNDVQCALHPLHRCSKTSRTRFRVRGLVTKKSGRSSSLLAAIHPQEEKKSRARRAGDVSASSRRLREQAEAHSAITKAVTGSMIRSSALQRTTCHQRCNRY